MKGKSLAVLRLQPPPEGMIKLNRDASYISSRNLAKLAFVLRNDQGHIILSGITTMTGIHSPLGAELMAISFGLEQVKEHNDMTILIESDSLLAIKEIQKGTSTLCQWGSIIDAILQDAAEFYDFQFIHILWEQNQSTDLLSREDCDIGLVRLWEAALPVALHNPDSN